MDFLKKLYGDAYDSLKDETTLLLVIKLAEESGIIQIDKTDK
jgi:hypothetical protein